MIEEPEQRFYDSGQRKENETVQGQLVLPVETEPFLQQIENSDPSMLNQETPEKFRQHILDACLEYKQQRRELENPYDNSAAAIARADAIAAERSNKGCQPRCWAKRLIQG